MALAENNRAGGLTPSNSMETLGHGAVTKVDVAGSTNSEAKGLSSKYHKHKREAVESFFNFVDNGQFPRWPLEMFLEVSNICDLKCAMCPTFSALNPERFTNLKKGDRGLIAFETATEPLEEILKHALVVHAFGYGEPTIHPQFREFVTYLSQFEVLVDFFTHGMHLTEDFCDFLVKSRVFRITLSFSGSTKEEYENVYIGGEFDRVMNGIRTLAAAKKKYGSEYPVIDVNSVGFQHHIDKLPDFVKMMGQAGVNRIHIKPLQTYDLIKELHTHASIMRPEVEGKIIEEAKRIALEYNLDLASAPYELTADAMEKRPDDPTQSRHKGFLKMSTDVYPILDLKAISKSREKKEESQQWKADGKAEKNLKNLPSDYVERRYMKNKGVPCLEPFKTFYASFDGRAYPCCFKANSGIPIGNLNDNSGEEIWRNNTFEEIRTQAMDNRYPSDMCAGCLKAQMQPKTHNLSLKLNQYNRWFQAGFKVPFHTHLLKKARELPENEQIIAALRERISPAQ